MRTHGKLDCVLYGLSRGSVDVVHREARAGLALASEMLRRREVHAGHGAESKGEPQLSHTLGIDMLTPEERETMTLSGTSRTTSVSHETEVKTLLRDHCVSK